MPRGVDGDPRVVVGDRDEDVVARDRQRAGGLRGRRRRSPATRRRSSGSDAVRPRARRAALRGARGRRWPSPRSCRHRRGSPSRPSPAWPESRPARAHAGTTRRYPSASGRSYGSRRIRCRDAPPAQGGASGRPGSRSSGAGRACRRSATRPFGSVRLWLVRTAMAIRSPGQPADDRPEPEEPAGVAERRLAVDVDDLDAEPVRDRRLESARSGRCPPTIAAARSGIAGRRRRTAPVAQRARSAGVVAIEPAAPDAVTTEVNGARSMPSDRSIGRELGVGAGEAIAVRDRTARRLDLLVPGVVQAERLEEALAQLVGERWPARPLRRASPRTR